jgi:hypothetical protein
MESMCCSDFRMVSVAFLRLRLHDCFAANRWSCCELVMFSRLLVVFSAFMDWHVLCFSLIPAPFIAALAP